VDRDKSVITLIQEARAAFANVPGRTIRVFNPSESMSGSSGGGFSVQLRGNLSLDELDRIASEFIVGLEQHPGYVDLDSSLKLGLPELRINTDREKAAEMGVDARTIAEVTGSKFYRGPVPGICGFNGE
jgi:multidrug efflux pump subunit AcrB